ncbi:flagellar hook-associated protein FlgL [Pseudomonas subflava]|uniref:flagellar hook-associated protein FlgL n=1 Tax=Pseudomonas subflava TaxID=2952933 RepID=UPI00207AE04E|nr:flagellar hook-associated protein FlgL [Pseudomonas subflava]
MRISTIQAFNSGVGGIQRNYENITRTQQQISSGSKILTPADDPVASVRLLQLAKEQSALDQYSSNLTAATNSLTQEESILQAIGNSMGRIQEIATEAGNGALSQEDRESLAAELDEREKELFNLMNSKNARGEYLFGGFQGKTQPYMRNADGTYSYVGDEGQRSVQIAGSQSVAITDNGKAIFDNVANASRLLTNAQTVPGSTLGIGEAIVTDEVAYNAFLRNNPTGGVEVVFDTNDRNSYSVYAYPWDGAAAPLQTGTLDNDPDEGDRVVVGGMSFHIDGEPAPTPKATGERFSIVPGRQSVDVQSTSTALGAVAISDLGAWQAASGGGTATLGVSNVVAGPPASFDLTLPSGATQNVSGTLPLTADAFGLSLRFDSLPAGGDSFDLTAGAATEKQSILNTVVALREALENGSDSPTGGLEIRDAVAAALTNLENGQSSVLKARGEIGARLNVVDSTITSNEDLSLINASIRSDLEDLDYAEALSRLSLQSVVLEAAQQSFVRISSLSLFNKL